MAIAVVQATLPLVTLMTTGVLITVRVIPQSVPDGVAYADGTGLAGAVAPLPPDAPAADEHPLVTPSNAAAALISSHHRTGRFVVTTGTFPCRAACPSRRTSGCLATYPNGSPGVFGRQSGTGSAGIQRPGRRRALDGKSLVSAWVTWQAAGVGADVVWWPAGPGASRDSVAALIVSYNTRELTAFLLWSLRTSVSWPELEIVVVDNASRDGSAQLLAEAERGGVCTLLANRENCHHGPGLNQGISYLASRPRPRPEWIWIVDSDVVAARPDALSAAVTMAREHSAALVGEPQLDEWHLDGRFGMYSLLMDPAAAWQQPTGPFADGGDPSLGLVASAARLGVPMAPFPFTAAGHIIHRGRGSLAAVYAAGDRSHPFYEWAAGHHAPHFAGVPGADQRYRALLREFRRATGPLTGTTLAAACRRAGRPAEW